MSSPTTNIKAACACQTFNLSVSFPKSSLPYPRALCLCDSCRRLSGSCGVSFITTPASTTIDPSSYSLTAYSVSPHATRYFCSTCGAHVAAYLNSISRWALATGLCDLAEGTVQWTGSKWIQDTLDGGVSVWFSDITDADGSKRSLQRWMSQDGKDGELVPAEALQKLSPSKLKDGDKGDGKGKEQEETLKAKCHCGGVQFYITRPNSSSETVYSPFPDLMIPYHTSSPTIPNPNHETWFLRANNTKYLAGTCTCTSCRLALGFEIQTWAFVPKCNIFLPDAQPMTYKMGTLKSYQSSEGVRREFCGRCGATVFWHCEERPELVDVSVGLLDPAEGARAEAWLEWWTERVSFSEMAVGRGLVESLEEGLASWGRRKKGLASGDSLDRGMHSG